jgi:hypothetical protein
LTKVNRFLRYLASNLEIPLDRPESQGESLVGPQANGLNQEQVDRLLRGEKL